MCIYWKETLYKFTADNLSAVISKVTQRKPYLHKRNWNINEKHKIYIFTANTLISNFHT
jgi:uncharacterized pyridoxamine 5'-phosphate oxidase family protein